MQAIIGWFLSIFLAALVSTPALAAVAVKQFEEKSCYLKDTDFINDAVGWAVGAPHWDQARKSYVGSIIKTLDGGATWVDQEAGVNELLNGVDFVDANNGWAVGANGTILHTSDGGAHWVKQTVATSHEFRSVAFATATQGWATTTQAIPNDPYGDNWVAAIWHTGDGGASWTPQTLPAGASILHKIKFIDANRGWAVGAKYLGNDQHGLPLHQPVVYRTSNGGSAWQEQYSPALEITFTSVDFVDANHGWVVGFKTSSDVDGGILFRTTDGGATWERLEAEIDGFFGIPRDVHFVDANRGYIVGTAYIGAWGPILNFTLDGGATWHRLKLNKWEFAALYGVWASGNRMVAVGDYDFLCYSTAPWELPDQFNESPYLTEKILNIHYQFNSVCFADANHGWAVGARQFEDGVFGQVIFGTQDGGTTWQTQYECNPGGLPGLFLGSPLNGVYFTDTQNGWAVGIACNSKRILHTADGGANWIAQGTELNNWIDFSAVQFQDNQNGWALTDSTFRSQILARTTNGGASWQWAGSPPESESSLRLNAFKFTDAQHGWAAGFMGVVLHTANGGASWTYQDLGPAGLYARLHTVDFITNQVGWVAGEGLFRTTDGGAHWTKKDIGVRGDIHAIQFLGPRRGWLAGDNGALMTTSNGGHTWTPVDSGTGFGLKGIAFSQRHPGVGWAVGDRGVIIKVQYNTGFPLPPGLDLLLD